MSTPGPVIVDVEGLSLTARDVARLQHPLVGGVILFARNFASRAQLAALTAAIHAVRTPPLLIAVDHEGGRVQRFRTDGFTALPAMAALGRLWDRDVLGAVKAATAVGYVLAAELRACGVDYSFTPVLDLHHERSEIIGERAFHRDPRVVSLLARGLNHGLLLAGMANCGKHFPGHGHAEADSHVALPVDDRPLDVLLAEDAAPYDWIGTPGLAAVMPAHVVYPQVDSRPAGFSRVWIQDILRKRLGFEGLVFSDDLSMEGAKSAGGIVERANAAFKAGCDVVLVCNDPDAADALLEGLRYRMPEASVQRLLRLAPRGPAPDWASLKAEPEYRRARALVDALKDLA